MIRKLTEENRANVFDFLSKEPSINLFMIGDIENFGFDEPFQEIWGQFTTDDKIEGVLLRFNENFIPYFVNPEFDTDAFKQIICEYAGKKIISGKESVVQNFVGVLPDQKVRTTYFCELTHSKHLKTNGTDNEIKLAMEADAQRVCDLTDSIEEFTRIDNVVEQMQHKIKTKTGRVYYIENNEGTMVSVTQTTAENSKSAMVVGVATIKEYRGKGLMSTCLSKLCLDVLSEGKTLCLFYDNPKAGRVYHKLGFQTIDNWMMITQNTKLN